MVWKPPVDQVTTDTGWRPPTDAVDTHADETVDNRRWDQKAADFLGSSPAVNNALQTIGSQPEMQPFQKGYPKLSDVVDTQNPNALGQTLGTLRKLYGLPMRFSQTLGAASEPVTDAVTDYLGKLRNENGENINPYVNAAVGMAAGVAVDPRSYVPISEKAVKAPSKADLPVMQVSKIGEPTALFDHNDPNTGKSSYMIQGDPAIHGYSTTPNVPFETLQQKGIPVVGKTQKAAQLGHEPLDVIPQSVPPGSSQGFFEKRGGVAFQNPDELPLNVAQAREARTGVAARDFQRLYKDPGAFLKGGKVKEVGAQIGVAKEAAGIDPGVTNDLASLTPDNIDRINPTKAVKIEDINTVIDKMRQKQIPTPQEAQNALDSVNSILSQPSVQNNRDVFRQWSAVKTHINSGLGQAAPEVRAANSAYAREKLGQTFSPLSAVNKSGTPSKLAMLARQIPGAVGGAVGGTLFGPWGAMGGYSAGMSASAAIHSPFMAGIQTAGGAIANQGIASFERGLTNSAVQSLMADYVQQRGKTPIDRVQVGKQSNAQK